MSTSSSKTFILPAAGRVFVTQPSASGGQEAPSTKKPLSGPLTFTRRKKGCLRSNESGQPAVRKKEGASTRADLYVVTYS